MRNSLELYDDSATWRSFTQGWDFKREIAIKMQGNMRYLFLTEKDLRAMLEALNATTHPQEEGK